MQSYSLIRLDSEENAQKLLDKKHIVTNEEVIVEYLYNCELLKELKQPSYSSEKEELEIIKEREVSSVNITNELLANQKFHEKPAVEIDLSNKEESKCFHLWDGVYLKELSKLGDAYLLNGNILKVIHKDEVDLQLSNDEYKSYTEEWKKNVVRNVEGILGQFTRHSFSSLIDKSTLNVN